MQNQTETILPVPPFDVLTDRERQVAFGIARGLKSKEIAEACGVSVKTVDTHRGKALKKLGVRGNVELCRLAIRSGWVQP